MRSQSQLPRCAMRCARARPLQRYLGAVPFDDAAKLRTDIAHDAHQLLMRKIWRFRCKDKHAGNIGSYLHREGQRSLETGTCRCSGKRILNDIKSLAKLHDIGPAGGEHLANKCETLRESCRGDHLDQLGIALGVIAVNDIRNFEMLSRIGGNKVGCADRPFHHPAYLIYHVPKRLADICRLVGGHGGYHEKTQHPVPLFQYLGISLLFGHIASYGTVVFTTVEQDVVDGHLNVKDCAVFASVDGLDHG
jgi:hypothetical protein